VSPRTTLFLALIHESPRTSNELATIARKHGHRCDAKDVTRVLLLQVKAGRVAQVRTITRAVRSGVCVYHAPGVDPSEAVAKVKAEQARDSELSPGRRVYPRRCSSETIKSNRTNAS
jgi:hypothetical protein